MEQSPTKCPIVEKELQFDKQQEACQNNIRQTKYDDIKLFFLIQMNGFEGSQHRELRNKVLNFQSTDDESPFLQDIIESNQQYKKALQSFLEDIDEKQEKIMDDNIQILAFIIQLQTAREIIYKDPIGNQFFSDKNGQEVHTEDFERLLYQNKLSLQFVQQYCEEVKLEIIKIQNRIRNKLKQYFDDKTFTLDLFYQQLNKDDLFNFCKKMLKNKEQFTWKMEKMINMTKNIIFKQQPFTNIAQFLHMQNELFKIKSYRPLSAIIKNAKLFLHRNPDFINFLDTIMNYLKKQKTNNQFRVNKFPDIFQIYNSIKEDLKHIVDNKKTSTCEEVKKLQDEFQKKLNCLDQ